MRTAKQSLLVLLTTLVLSLTLPAALPGPALARSYDGEELRFVQLINSYRAQHGLATLTPAGDLAEAAARHALDMGRHSYFSHTTQASDFFPVGSAPWDRIRLMGYDDGGTSGENIAGGQNTAQAVFDAWRASSGHNAIMLNSKFRAIGIARRAVSGSPYGVYWVADFAARVDGATRTTSSAAPFTDVSRSDAELWAAAAYVKSVGYFQGYNGALGCWQPMTRRHVALVLKRAGLGSRPNWEQDYRPATRGEVMAAFPGLEWKEGRTGERILRSQVVRLLYRAR